jgi:hypothetical protein
LDEAGCVSFTFSIVIIAGKTPGDMGCFPHKDKPARLSLSLKAQGRILIG